MVPDQCPDQPRSLLRRPVVVRLLAIALLAEIAYAVLNISTMPVYLKFDRGFGASIIGLVLAAFLFSEAVFKGPMGAFADRFGRRRLMMLGPAMTAVTALLTLLIPHEGLGAGETLALVVLRVLDGLGAAMLWPAAFALMGDSVEDGCRQQAMSLLNTCYLLGVALALPIGGAFNDLVGPHIAEFSGARSPGLFLAAGLFAAAALTAHFTKPGEHGHHHASHDHGAAEAGLRELWSCARTIPQYLLLAVVTFMGIGFPMAIVKLFAEQQFEMSESRFGALAFPAVILMALLGVPMAKLGERIGRARAVHYGLFLCTIGMAGIGVGAVVPPLRLAILIAVGGLLVGFGFLLAIPAWLASVSDIDARKRGAYIGAVMTAQGVGAIIGAPIGAVLYDQMQPVGVSIGLGPDFGRYSPFVGCAVCVLAAWLLSIRILHDRPSLPERLSDG